MKRILVTGGAGFIGSTTVDHLLAKGYEVRVMDSLQERVHPNGWPAYLPPQVAKLQGDVRNRQDWLRALEGVEGVFHLAAYQDYMPDFSTFFHVNATSTALLYELIVEHQLPVQKVVLASSQAVYGEGKYHCPADGVVYPPSRPAEQLARGEWELRCPGCGGPLRHLPLTEDQAHPHTAYGISKYTLELAAFNLGRKYGIPSVCMRYSIVQGPRNSFYNAYSGICRIFTLRLLHDQPPVCYEDGRSLRDYVYVGDVARANVLVMEDGRADYRAFNVAGQRATSVLEYARLAARVCGKDLEPLLTGEYRFGDTRHTVSSWEALGALGWRPEVPLEEVIAEYADWVQAQPDLGDFYARSATRMRAAQVLRQAAR
ncbi:MAG: NAD-dependent epimerase/dehydratase family protein [Candidatus Handelsmanbacteria bacterium]|nr:NAD-dependent epimerase/dehydratase family protein [Candidatus Handelsmanbacteria bacterium]